MKFGILLQFRGPSNDPPTASIYDQAMAEATAAERLGFDSCYVPEHHLAPDGTMPRAIAFAGAILARTSKLRVGTAVLQLNVHHPLTLAEEISVIDNISRGRLTVGVGLTSFPETMRAFGADPKGIVSRFEEIISILRMAASGCAFSHQGKHFQFENVRVTPVPYTPGGPPIWIGARVPRSLERVGRIADGWISDPMHSIPVMKQSADLYRKAATANGRKPYVALIRDVWVARTREEVREIWWPHVRAYHHYYSFLFNPDWEPWLREIRSPVDWTFERIAPGRLICGTPQDVISQIQDCEKGVACDEIVFSFRYATGPESKRVREMLELVGREVLPAFRS